MQPPARFKVPLPRILDTSALRAALSNRSNMTHGLEIIARSMSVATSGANGYAHGNLWQYHPRSDRHSKISCWAIFFDLMLRESLLSRHVRDGKVSFGINHKMRDFQHDREKDLDLVICRRSEPITMSGISNFEEMVDAYTIVLDEKERALLDALPDIPLTGVQSALVALEAKAAATEFAKARPRLYDELNSSHLTIHGDTDSAIAAGFVMVNIASTFVSPLLNPWTIGGDYPTRVTVHNQPKNALSIIDKMMQLPRRAKVGDAGFDAFAIAIMEFANNGSPVRLEKGAPSPQPGDAAFYNNFVERIETIYASRFSGI
jgi:hypothetical protein